MGYNQFCENLSIKLKNIKPLIEEMMLKPSLRNTVGLNKKWKKMYQEKRCFIVGNGPSLKKQDLSLLSEEYVFTVNQIMRSDVYQALRSDFHVIADPLYFRMDKENPDHQKIIQSILKINYEDKKPECFFPITSKPDVERLGLGVLNTNYYLSGYQTSDHMTRKIDLTKSIYSFNTVAQYAICIAIYMGFSEIYLLGCDMTGYKEVEQFATGSFTEQTHIYSETSEDMKKALHNQRTCEEWFVGFAKMFVDYRRLHEFALSKNIKLINLSAGGVLDSLPRDDFESLVKGSE